MFLSVPPLRFGRSCNWKRVKRGGKYGLEIPAIFLFYVPEKVIKLAKNKITKIEENLNESVKHCLK